MQTNNETSGERSRCAVIPVKVLGEAKQRLNTTLGADRRTITLAMLRDVLCAVAASQRIARVAVVTADVEVARVARDLGARVIDEHEPRGMNGAIKLGMKHVQQVGGGYAVILPADIPLATGAELDRLLQLHETEQRNGGNSVIGITPSADGRGTNLLCLDTNRDFQICYGPNSYSLHLERALQSNCRSMTLDSLPLSLDIDNRADLQLFIQTCLAESHFRATATWKFLRTTGLLETLRAKEGDFCSPGSSQTTTWVYR